MMANTNDRPSVHASSWESFDAWYAEHGWKYVSSREGAFVVWKAARADIEAELLDTRLQCITDFGQYQEAHEQLAAEKARVKTLIAALYWLADSATGSELQHIHKTIAISTGT